MAKKGRVSSILMSGVKASFAATYFRVGDNPLKNDGTPCVDAENNPAFPPVAKIQHCKHEFGEGALMRQPCYAVSFENSPETITIPITQVAQVTIVVIEDSDTTTPAMPQ